VRLAITDLGAGVDPAAIQVTVDRTLADHRFRNGILTVTRSHLARGQHRLSVLVADYQETKNMENVLNGATPNTRAFATTFSVP
jgi:hypothetical protein